MHVLLSIIVIVLGDATPAHGGFADTFLFKFSTKCRDPETGLYYYGRRYYRPPLGCWLSRDPIEEDGGLNLYAIVGNDPVNKWDYLGMAVGVEVCVRPLAFAPKWFPWWASLFNHAYIQIGDWSAGFQNDGNVYSPEQLLNERARRCTPAVKVTTGRLSDGTSCKCAKDDQILSCVKSYAKTNADPNDYLPYNAIGNNCGHWVINVLKKCCLQVRIFL